MSMMYMHNLPDEKITPVYEHDCEACVFLGRFHLRRSNEAAVVYDLYYCGTHEDGTVIGRYSDDGPDYCSGMAFAEQGIEPYAEARKRAIARGLYNPKPQPPRWPHDSSVREVVALHDQFMRVAASAWLLSDEQRELWFRQLRTLSGQERDLSEVIDALIAYVKSQ